jgi:hypothetical protein
MQRIATQEAAKLRLEITSRGINAWRPARRSSGRKAPIPIAAITSIAITRGSPQPQSSTWSRAISNETRPIEIAAIPG